MVNRTIVTGRDAHGIQRGYSFEYRSTPLKPVNAEVGPLSGMGASFFKNMPFLLPSWYDAQLANKKIKKIAGSIFILAA